MSSADEPPAEKDDGISGAMSNKIAGRKKRLKLGYQISSKLYLVSSVLNLFKRGFQPLVLFYIFGGGVFTVSMLLYILRGAAANDRLASDTYKRLNLTVIGFSLLQLFMPAYHWSEGLVFKLPAIVALVNGVKGYGYGVLGWDKSKEKSAILSDIKDGVTSPIQVASVVKKESLGYLIGTTFLGVMTSIRLLDFVKVLVLPAGEGANKSYMILSRMSRLARLGVMTSIMYTLKDAADRGRLSGSTFVQLNYLMTAAFLTMSFFLSPTGPTPLGVLTGALSALTLYSGVTNVEKKK